MNCTNFSSAWLGKGLWSIYDIKNSVQFCMSAWLIFELPKTEFQNNNNNSNLDYDMMSPFGGRESCAQGFGGETWGKETTGETKTYMGG